MDIKIQQDPHSVLKENPAYQRLMDYIALTTRLDPEKSIPQSSLFENPFVVAGLQTTYEMKEAIEYLRSVQAIKGIGDIQVSINAQNLASKKALLTLENRV